jgi:hypothetical protein
MPYLELFAGGKTPYKPSVYDYNGVLRRVVGISGTIKPTDMSVPEDNSHVVLSGIIFFPQSGYFSDINKELCLWAEVGIIRQKWGGAEKFSVFACKVEKKLDGNYAWKRNFIEDAVLNQEYTFQIYISGYQVYVSIGDYQEWLDYSFLETENREVMIGSWNGEYKSYTGTCQNHLHGRFTSCMVKQDNGPSQSFIPKLLGKEQVYYAVRDSEYANALWVHGGVS